MLQCGNEPAARRPTRAGGRLDKSAPRRSGCHGIGGSKTRVAFADAGFFQSGARCRVSSAKRGRPPRPRREGPTPELLAQRKKLLSDPRDERAASALGILEARGRLDRRERAWAETFAQLRRAFLRPHELPRMLSMLILAGSPPRSTAVMAVESARAEAAIRAKYLGARDAVAALGRRYLPLLEAVAHYDILPRDDQLPDLKAAIAAVRIFLEGQRKRREP